MHTVPAVGKIQQFHNFIAVCDINSIGIRNRLKDTKITLGLRFALETSEYWNVGHVVTFNIFESNGSIIPFRHYRVMMNVILMKDVHNICKTDSEKGLYPAVTC